VNLEQARPDPASDAPIVTLVVMGVAGVGKSSVMAALAERLGWPALEGDTLHPPANVAKMGAGIPLTDEDRRPWLERIATWIGERERAGSSSILTCSALRRGYRDILRSGHPSVLFVHLVAPEVVIEERIGDRAGHFMPASMLASQLETLEPLDPDEPGWAVDAMATRAEIATQIIAALGLDPG
jgi:gluconokinase